MQKRIGLSFFLFCFILFVFENATSESTSKTQVNNRTNDERNDDDKAKTDAPQNVPESLLYTALVSLLVCLVLLLCICAGVYCRRLRRKKSANERKVVYQVKGRTKSNQEAGDTPAFTSTMIRFWKKYAIARFGNDGLRCIALEVKQPLLMKKKVDEDLSAKAEVYHYQQIKKNLKDVLKKHPPPTRFAKQFHAQDGATPLLLTEGETSDGEMSVYGCPGLAAGAEEQTEIRNPLFDDIATDSEMEKMPLKAQVIREYGHTDLTAYGSITRTLPGYKN